MTTSLKNLPNYITAFRMLGTVFLLFTRPLTLGFFVIYTLTGITDIMDGLIARRLKLTSSFGAKLDSVADLLFYTIMLIMIFPILISELPVLLWVLIGFAVIFRIITYLIIAIKTRQFASTHSIFNKVTGFCVFMVPFVLVLSISVPIFWVICLIGFLSSACELYNACFN